MQIGRFKKKAVPSRRRADAESAPKKACPEETFQPSTPLWKRVTQTVLPFTKPKERQWTVLYYGAGNNNLSRDLGMEMGGLRNAGSSEEIQLVAQLAKSDQDGKAIRGEMAKIPVRFGAVRPEFVEEEALDADMGQKATFAEFLKWGMEKYPAKHYMVIQAGHGNGHRGSMTDETTGSIISLPEQREALEEAPAKVDLLLKESCMGASVEEAYEMKDTVGYFLASQDVTSGSVELGKSFQQVRLDARKGDVSPTDLLETLVENRSKNATTFAAVDQSKMAEVGQAITEFAEAADSTEGLREAANSTPRVIPDGERLTSSNDVVSTMELKRIQYRDALGFSEKVSETVPELSEEADAVALALQKAIVHQFSAPDYTGQQGLSWNLSPDPSITAGAGYQNLAFAQDTGWDGMV